MSESNDTTPVNDTADATESDAETGATHDCPAPNCERTFADEDALRGHIRAVGLVD